MSGTLDQLIVVVAQWLPPLVVVAAGGIGMMLPRKHQVRLAVRAVLALVLAVLAVTIAGTLHVDPRPFVVDPRVHPLFAHPADNGFPSDHTTFAVAAAATLLPVRRRTALVLLALGLLGGLARVAAHVHHVQDIAGGALLGLSAAGLAALVAPHVLAWPPLHRVEAWWGRGTPRQTSSARRARTRWSISSRMGRTRSTGSPAGSSRAQSR